MAGQYHSGHNIPMALLGTFYPGLRLFRVQPRFTLRYRLPYRCRRCQYYDGRYSPTLAVLVVMYGEVRSLILDAGPMSPGRSRCHHGALRNSLIPIGAVAIGAIAGVIVYFTYNFLDRN